MRFMRCSPWKVSAILLFSLALPTLSFGQNLAPPEEGKTADIQPKEGSSATSAKSKRPVAPRVPSVTELEELIIIGKIQKPNVFYVLSRTDFRYKGLTLKESFLDRIRKSVRGNPF